MNQLPAGIEILVALGIDCLEVLGEEETAFDLARRFKKFEKDIYINSFMSQKTVSGVHLRQLNLGKSRAILGLYGNRQQYAPVAGGGK